MARLDKATLLTANQLRSGNPVVSIVNDASGRPTTITYSVVGPLNNQEVVTITYSAAGDPIFQGITYPGHSVNVFRATLEASPKISGSSEQATSFSAVYDAIPVTGTKTNSIDVSLLDNVAIVVELSVGSSTTATVTPEASIDDTNWVPLTEQTLSVNPSDTIALFNLNQVPFTNIRISFDLIASGGDTFTVDASAKGLS